MLQGISNTTDIKLINTITMELKHFDSGNVRVICRFRPLNAKEKELGVQTVQQICSEGTVKVKDPKVPEPLVVSLDRIFDMGSTQESIYEISARPVVNSVLEGFNGTIFAYGQTSSGKTFTMQGYDIQNPANKGIIPRMIEQVFTAISVSPENIEWRLKVSIVELYMEKVRDLLDISKQDLKIRSSSKLGIYIEDATEKYVSEAAELYALMQIGNKNRVSCSTNMNERSSRSHMIFLITIAQSNLRDLSAKSGKLFLVDLAGSEKISKTGAEGKVLDQAKKINMSLTTLGKVIKALTQGKGNQHVPYRESKLTRILQESLGGNARTTLIITCSPHPINLQETISTLRFGISAKKITNKAKINRELTVGELQILLEKAQKQTAEAKQYISTLQRYITDELKAALPTITKQPLKKQKPEKSRAHTEVSHPHRHDHLPTELAEQADSESNNNEDNNEEDAYEHVPKPVPTAEADQRVHILQLQLESYKSILQSQTEKLNNLRMDYTLLHSSSLQFQKESEHLKQDNAKLRHSMNKAQQRLEDQSILQLNSDQNKNIGSMVLSEVLSLLKSEERRSMIEQLKKKRWYNELESQNFNVSSFWQQEKTRLMKELQLKIERVNTLQKNLEVQSNRNKLRMMMDANATVASETEAEERYRVLEKNLQDLHTQYYDMATLQSTWKAECQLYEYAIMLRRRKLHKKCKQVKELQDLINELRREVDQYKEKECDFNSVIQVTGSKLVKPIRGGNKVYQFS